MHPRMIKKKLFHEKQAPQAIFWIKQNAPRPDFLNKSWCVLCPIDIVCNFFSTNHSSGSSSFNSLINWSINYSFFKLWPACSTFVFTTATVGKLLPHVLASSFPPCQNFSKGANFQSLFDCGFYRKAWYVFSTGLAPGLSLSAIFRSPATRFQPPRFLLMPADKTFSLHDYIDVQWSSELLPSTSKEICDWEKNCTDIHRLIRVDR